MSKWRDCNNAIKHMHQRVQREGDAVILQDKIERECIMEDYQLNRQEYDDLADTVRSHYAR